MFSDHNLLQNYNVHRYYIKYLKKIQIKKKINNNRHKT